MVRAIDTREAADFAAIEASSHDLVRQIGAAGGRASGTLVLRVGPEEELLRESIREFAAEFVLMDWGNQRSLRAAARGLIRSGECPVLLVGPEFAQDSQGVEVLGVGALPPLARMAAAASRLAEVPSHGGLLVQLESTACQEVAS